MYTFVSVTRTGVTSIYGEYADRHVLLFGTKDCPQESRSTVAKRCTTEKCTRYILITLPAGQQHKHRDEVPLESCGGHFALNNSAVVQSADLWVSVPALKRYHRRVQSTYTHLAPKDGPTVVLGFMLSNFSFGDFPHASLVLPSQILRSAFQ